jgi:signal transduction histidine kinase
MDSIINGFLTFARPVEPMKAHLDLKELLRSSISSALAQGAGIEAVFSFEGPESIRADELLLRQAFTNIIQNAAQAMPEGGRLTVRSSVGDERAVVAVSDTGHGIPEEIKDKIFLPFYTTKEGGTGLGLAIAHGIVQSHGGTIEVDSSPSGTTFTVRLPA